MMVAKIPAITPRADNTPASGEVQNDGQAFASMLDEKKAAQAHNPQRLGRPLSAMHFRELADRADAQVDKEEADVTGKSLLALLNQTLEGAPGAGEEKKDKMSLVEDSGIQNVPLPSDGAQPVPLVAGIDSPLLTATAEQPGEATDAALDTLLAPLAALPSADKEDNSAVPVLNINAKPESQPTLVATGKNEPDVTQGTAFVSAQSPSGDVSGLKMPSPQLESNVSPTKGNELSHEVEQASFNPDFNLPAVPAVQSSSTADVERTLSTGALTQEMGTPAWQQSLGQQIASFTRNGIQHAELRLHPEELGSLQINLQLKNEQAQLHFVSESHQVRAAIEAAVPHLRTSLAESGIELGQSSVGAETSSSWKDTGQSEQNSRQNFADQEHRETMPFIEDIVETSVRTVGYSNGINTFA